MKLEIEKCIYGGAGLARAEGKTIFVPFTLPGETVEARIVEDKRSFANAELDAVLRPSLERATPPCEYFGVCGGCQYQHANYAQQVAIKQSILQETLSRAGLIDIPEIIPIHAEPLGYRNRIRLHLQQRPFAACYKQRASHRNLPVTHCPIAAPILEKAIAVVTNTGEALHLADDFAEIELFTNESESEMLLSLWSHKPFRNENRLAQICDELRKQLPTLTGAAIFHVDKRRHSTMQTAQWGKQTLTYQASSRRYQVSIGAFFQVNRFLVDRLIELVITEHSGKTAWDLYAGVGLFSTALAERFESVIAVEAATSSRDLRQNLTGPNHKAIQSDTLRFLQQQSTRPGSASPELIVVDPPRAGLGSDVTTLLTKVRARSIVYVSCDPATLSRDLRALVESGYHLRTMHLVDLFPQTFHLESVTLLSLD